MDEAKLVQVGETKEFPVSGGGSIASVIEALEDIRDQYGDGVWVEIENSLVSRCGDTTLAGGISVFTETRGSQQPHRSVIAVVNAIGCA